MMRDVWGVVMKFDQLTRSGSSICSMKRLEISPGFLVVQRVAKAGCEADMIGERLRFAWLTAERMDESRALDSFLLETQKLEQNEFDTNVIAGNGSSSRGGQLFSTELRKYKSVCTRERA